MKKKYKIISLIISLIFITKGYGQNSYLSLYDVDGGLLYDTSYKIENVKSLPKPVGMNIYESIITNIHYPIIAISNGLSQEFIVKLTLLNDSIDDSYRVKNIFLIKGDTTILTNLIVENLYILFNNISFFSSKKGVVIYELFVPFNFKVELSDETNFPIIENTFSFECNCFVFNCILDKKRFITN